MKWFLKVLKHYANFSGRARRKEYWMFMLFYFIFSFVWGVLTSFVILLITNHYHSAPLEMIINASFSYSAVLFLPGLGVAVRRLHDIGKSGWMLLVGLIPLVGGIWLLVMMLTEGQDKANKYGPNPKTSPETFSDQAKLKSAGVTLIIASAFMILLNITSFIIFKQYGLLFYILKLFSFAAMIVLLVSGTFLLKGNTCYEIQGKKKNVILLLLTAVGMLFVLTLINLISVLSIGKIDSGRIMINIIIQILFYLLFALFVASLLFIPRDEKHVRTTAILSLVFSGLYLLWSVYFNMWINAHGDGISTLYQFQNHLLVFQLLLPVAFIVLTGTFLSSARGDGTTLMSGKVYYEYDNRGMRVETAEQSMAYWIGERVQAARKDPFVYYIFENSSDAKEAMLALPFIHLTDDTGKLICDDVLRFGYYAKKENGVPTGKYDAFVAGAALTYEMWRSVHTSFIRHNGRKWNDLEPDKTVQAPLPATGNPANAVFVREDRKSTNVWRIYKAPCKADALAYLSRQQVSRSFFYIIVETPEGSFGKDINGFYQE